MKFFIDTANLDEIKKVAEWGLIDGVTTNPSLMAKEGKGFKETIQSICEVVSGPVSAEVVSAGLRREDARRGAYRRELAPERRP